MSIKRLGTKLSLVVVAGIVITSLILSYISINVSEGIVESLIGEKALSIANATAAHIDGDEFERLVALGSEEDSFYIDLQSWMYNLLKENEVTYLYSMTEASNTEYEYIVDGSDTIGGDNFSAIGDLDLKENYGQEPLDVLIDGKSRYSEMYDSGDWGNLVSAFAPILNSKEEIVGIVGADVSAEAITQITQEFVLKLLIGVLVVIIIVVALFLLIIRKLISNPIGRVVSYTAQIANKQYNFDVDEKLLNRSDEIGVLANGIMNIMKSTSEVLRQITNSSNNLASSASSLSETSRETAISINEVSLSINSIAESATDQATSTEEGNSKLIELKECVDQNNAYINALVESSDIMSELVVVGEETIDDVLVKSKESSEAISQIQLKLEQTRKSSDAISNATNVIASIAEQTNLLALNASIEAARAGEHGRGFAVVADEIRKLAEQSSASTQEIDEVIKELHVNIKETIEVMKLVIGITKSQNESVGNSLEQYSKINNGIDVMNTNIHNLNGSSQEIINATEVLNAVIENISRIAEGNAANSEEVSAATQEQNASINEVSNSSALLSELSNELKAIVNTFKL